MHSDTQTGVAPRRSIIRDKPADRFGVYHDLIQSSGSTTTRYGGVFASAVTAYDVPQLSLFDRQLVGVEHFRDTAQIKRDGFEHYYLQVLRSGRMISGALGDERPLAPGDAVLFDARQPQRSRVADADSVTIVLARDLVEAAAPNARQLHGRILPRSDAGSIGDIVLALARRVADSSADVEGGGRLIASLLGETAGDTTAFRDAMEEGAEADMARRLKAELFIDANLGRTLDAADVAHGIGLSRSSLYRAYETSDGIEAIITKRRVARLRSMILQPEETRPIDDLCHMLGFSSASHGSRVFKQIYGLPPSRLRAEMRGRVAIAEDLNVDRMREWYRTLNRSRDLP